MKDNSIQFEEFDEILWESVSEKVVSNRYLDEYPDFIENLTFDFYKLHIQGGVDIKILSKILESMFFSLFRYNSSCEDFVDDRRIQI